MTSAITIIIWLILAFILGYLLRYIWTQAAGHSFGRLRFWVLPLMLIWGGLSTWWYTCELKNECGNYQFAQAPTIEPAAGPATITPEAVAIPEAEPPVQVAQVAPPTPSWPLYFDWDNPTALTGPGFDTLTEQIKGKLGPGQKLKIIGLYSPEEANPTSQANLGLARAAATRELLAQRIPADQIEIGSEVFASDAWTTGQPFELARFETLAAPPPPLDIRQTVYFGRNSTTPQTAIALDETAIARINAEKTSIRLIGHTDNYGDIEYNRLLGQKRALAVKEALVKKGVEAQLITLATEGEKKPAESNTSRKGQQMNRRVDIEIR